MITQDTKGPCCQASLNVYRRANANQDTESGESPSHMSICNLTDAAAPFKELVGGL